MKRKVKQRLLVKIQNKPFLWFIVNADRLLNKTSCVRKMACYGVKILKLDELNRGLIRADLSDKGSSKMLKRGNNVKNMYGITLETCVH